MFPEQSANRGLNAMQDIADKLPGVMTYTAGWVAVILLLHSLALISRSLKRIAIRLEQQ